MMNNIIDCLIIGNNEMNFAEYEETVRKMGTHTGAYKDLNLNFVNYNGGLYTAPEIFNHFFYGDKEEGQYSPFTTGETFSGAISYLGTFLDRRGFSFDYINSYQDQKEELAEKLKTNTYRTIAITTTLYVSVFPIKEIMDFIKKYNDESKILVGGPYVISQYRAGDDDALEYVLNTVIQADVYVISSQGEKALTEILTAYKNNESLVGIQNICYRTEDGDYKWNEITREANPLGENMVNWDLFGEKAGEYVNLRTAISCPFSCKFCGFPEHAGRYQTATVEEVEGELNLLRKIKAVKWVHFIDDTFNIPAKRFKDLLRMLIRNKYNFRWYSHYRCQFADLETVELMKESGCEGVFLGIESGSDPILKGMNKAAKVEKYLEGIRLLKQVGIMSYGSFIMGFPGETDETAQETMDFIRDGGLDFYRAQMWYCDPITPIWKQREEYKLWGEGFQWAHSTMDSKRAAEWVDKIFLEVDSPTWVPQYNFECDALFHLLERGLSWQQITEFCTSFNNAVKERMDGDIKQEMSPKYAEEIRRSLQLPV